MKTQSRFNSEFAQFYPRLRAKLSIRCREHHGHDETILATTTVRDYFHNGKTLAQQLQHIFCNLLRRQAILFAKFIEGNLVIKFLR